MRTPALSLRAAPAILRRRWIVVALAAVLGLGAGFGYSFLHAAPPETATVLVEVPQQTGSGATGMQTLQIVATSNDVLTLVARESPPMRAQQLAHAVSASIVTDSSLRLQAHAATAERAVQLANTYSAEYRDYIKNHGLAGGPMGTIGNASLLKPPSSTPRIARDALVGLVIGLLVGTVGVLVTAGRDHRLRGRDDIADAIGVPVLASMQAEEYKHTADWIRLLERFQPSVINALNLRRLLRHLVPADLAGPFTVQVISLTGDKAALAAGPELALFAAGSGMPTRLAPGENVALEPLIAACAALRTANHADRLLTFGVEGDERKGPIRRASRWYDDPALTQPNLLVSVAAIDPSRPEMTSIAGATILALSSGFASFDDLARVALASTRAGLWIEGIVVVNPDPDDSTTGLLPARVTSGWRSHDPHPAEGPDAWATSRGNRQGGQRWPGGWGVDGSDDADRNRRTWPSGLSGNGSPVGSAGSTHPDERAKPPTRAPDAIL